MTRLAGFRGWVIAVIAAAVCAGSVRLCAAQQNFQRMDDIKESLEQTGSVPTPETDLIVRPSVTYTAQELRDPFKMLFDEQNGETVPGVVEVPLPELAVQGVIWGTPLPQAIINNTVVKVGDELSGARIIDITKDTITVFFGSRNYTLTTPSGALQKPAEQQGGKNEKPNP